MFAKIPRLAEYSVLYKCAPMNLRAFTLRSSVVIITIIMISVVFVVIMISQVVEVGA